MEGVNDWFFSWPSCKRIFLDINHQHHTSKNIIFVFYLMISFLEELPNNEQILSSMLSIKFWWQSCHNECCLVEWQHYDSPTSEYSNISQVQSRTVSELGLEQDTLRWLSPGSWIPGPWHQVAHSTVASLILPNCRSSGSRSQNYLWQDNKYWGSKLWRCSEGGDI